MNTKNLVICTLAILVMASFGFIILQDESDAATTEFVNYNGEINNGTITLRITDYLLPGAYHADIGMAAFIGTLESDSDILVLKNMSPEDYSLTEGNWNGIYLKDGDNNNVAIFSITVYKVTLDSNGGIGDRTMYASGTVTAPGKGTMSNGDRTFLGWATSATGPAVWQPGADITINQNTTLYAVWSGSGSYTIKFVDTDGSTITEISGPAGSPVAAPTNPTKEGYTFAGWDKEIPTTMPAENITITAQWTINQYTVKFIADGVIVQETTQDYGSAITAPADPTKEGYTFAGWDSSITTVPAMDVEFNAQWTINQYTVKFIADGVIVQETTQDYGSAITAPADPTKEGYAFVGWMPDVPATVPANNLEFVADFAPTGTPTYTITTEIIRGNGTITPSFTVYENRNATVEIVAGNVDLIERIVVDDIEIQNVDGTIRFVQTFQQVTTNHEVSVEFRAAALYDVDLTVGNHGNAMITGLSQDGKIIEGRGATLHVDPSFGYVATVKVNGNEVELTDDEYFLVAQNTTVDVSFTLVVIDDGDDEDDKPSTPTTPVTPETPESGDSDDGDNITTIAIAAAAVVAVIAALSLVLLRKD